MNFFLCLPTLSMLDLHIQETGTRFTAENAHLPLYDSPAIDALAIFIMTI